MNSTKQYVNSEPCEVTVHARKKKKKKGRKRRRDETRYPNTSAEPRFESRGAKA